MFKSKLFRYAGPACALLVCTATHAACLVPAPQEEVPPAQAPALSNAMLDALPQCQKDPAWLAALGHLLNLQARYLEAADHLERALMLAPELQSAQLDYALALAGLGDTQSALLLIKDLLTRPELPAHLRPVLTQQVVQWSAPLRPEKTWSAHGSVGARLGWDSNLLGAPNLDALTLTFPGYNQVMQLDGNYRAVSGAYARADAQLSLRRVEDDGRRWLFDGSVRGRTSPGHDQTGFSQLDLQLERNTYQLSQETIGQRQGYYAGAAISALNTQTGTDYQALGLNLGWGAEWAPQTAGVGCQSRLGAELQERRYTSNPLLSGRYSGLNMMMTCAQPSATQWLLSLKTGHDLANSAERAGGDQLQTMLRLVGYMPMKGQADAGGRAYLLVDLELTRQQDSGPYSALLDGGSVRNLLRQAARLEWQKHPEHSVWRWSVGAEWVQQQSNLPLFANRSWGPYASLHRNW